MLYKAEALIDFRVKTTDGYFGDIQNLYFDDRSWIVRYLVVDIGGWLSNRQVLISPEALQGLDKANGAFVTKLTREQIESSPGIDSEQTVSRKHEELLSQHYGWSPYWVTPLEVYPFPGIYTFPPYPAGSRSHDAKMDIGEQRKQSDQREHNDRLQNQEIHLRSFKEIQSYGLHAIDGDIGELDDLLIRPEDWQITHLIADTRKWWPGGQVAIDRGLVENMSWDAQKISVAMTRDQVKNSPPYDSDDEVEESWQAELSDYYQRIAPRSPPDSTKDVPGQQPRL